MLMLRIYITMNENHIDQFNAMLRSFVEMRKENE